jgi:AraC-like DNA-binding protein
VVASRRVDVDAVTESGFGLAEEVQNTNSGAWHAHAKHQLLYASEGSLILSVATRRWILPPQRAAWIEAGTQHAVTSTTGASLRTVYLAKSLASESHVDCRVFAVTPLAREMILFAMRWGPDGERSKTRSAFFEALAGLALEWMKAEKPYHLPAAQTPELARAMRFIDAHLDSATVEATAKAARLSVRTLTRRFDAEAQMSFRDYLQAARMMRAMELLARAGASVTQTAYEVGFKSLGAFTTAFRERCGETPTEYRARQR